MLSCKAIRQTFFFCPVSPVIISPTPVLSVDEFNTAILTCTATARPAANITWSKWKTSLKISDGIVVTYSNAQLNRVTGLSSVTSQLKILNTTFGDRGHYTCTAFSSRHLTPFSATAPLELVVNGKIPIVRTCFQVRSGPSFRPLTQYLSVESNSRDRKQQNSTSKHKCHALIMAKHPFTWSPYR